jgi:5-methyltetrahydrofolate--homocysteine methyltransferase
MIYVAFNFQADLVLCSITKQIGLPMHDLSALQKAVIEGEVRAAVAAAREALDAGVRPVDLISQGIGPAMAEVGKLFEEGEYFVPELLMAARATKEIFIVLRPLLAQTGARPMAQVLLGTVQGDLHDIGKNLVAAMLEGGGFEVTDLGVDVPPEKFIEAVKKKPVQIVGLSALLTTTMPAMKNTIEAFRTAGIRDQVKFMVGGAPVTRSYAESIGADGYSETAAASVDLARRLTGTLG